MTEDLEWRVLSESEKERERKGRRKSLLLCVSTFIHCHCFLPTPSTQQHTIKPLSPSHAITHTTPQIPLRFRHPISLFFLVLTHSHSPLSSFLNFFLFFLQNKFLSKFFRSFLSLIAQRREVGGIVGVSEERVGRLEEHAIQNVFFRQGIGVCAPCQQCLQFFLKKGTDGCCAGSSIFVAFLI